MHLRSPAAVPGRKQDTTATTLVLNVFKAVHEIRNASKTEGEAAKTQRPSTTSISTRPSRIVSYATTYCVLLPVSNEQFVIARCPHAGQSAGAGPRPKLAIGVAFWYTWPDCCWGGMPGWGPGYAFCCCSYGLWGWPGWTCWGGGDWVCWGCCGYCCWYCCCWYCALGSWW